MRAIAASPDQPPFDEYVKVGRILANNAATQQTYLAVLPTQTPYLITAFVSRLVRAVCCIGRLVRLQAGPFMTLA